MIEREKAIFTKSFVCSRSDRHLIDPSLHSKYLGENVVELKVFSELKINFHSIFYIIFALFKILNNYSLSLNEKVLLLYFSSQI